MTVHEVLVAARNHIDNVGWAQGRPDGEFWFEDEAQDGSCVHNAVLRCNDERFNGPYAEAIDTLCLIVGVTGHPRLYRWNDAAGRTKAEVLAALDEAIRITAPPPQDLKWSEIVEELETTRAVLA